LASSVLPTPSNHESPNATAIAVPSGASTSTPVTKRWFTGLLTPEQLEPLAAGLRIVRDAVRPEATAHTPD
jgi:hypothetical protein